MDRDIEGMQRENARISVLGVLLLCGTSMVYSMTAEVKDHLGSPMLFINGQPRVPFMFYGYPDKIAEDSNCPFIRQANLAKDIGVNLYTFTVDFVWAREGVKPDFSSVDELYDNILKFDPDALLLPRFPVHPPKWWIKEHPEALGVFSDGTQDSFSVASKQWRSLVQKSLQQYIRYCEKKYGDHIIGYHPCALQTAEWFYKRSWESVHSHFEEPFRAGFAEWLQTKYGSVSSLQKAWNNSSVNFDNVVLPTAEERGRMSKGLFRDPIKDKFIIDFYEYKPIAIAEALQLFAKTIKQETAGSKLVAFFYGYTFELGAVSYGPQVTGHLAFKKVLECPDIDLLIAQISYGQRSEGGIGSFMAAVDSVRRAGKLWLNEDDTRTCLADATQLFGRVETLQDTQWVHDRNFAHVLPRRMGCWYMDLFNKSWMDSPELWANISRLKDIYQQQLSQPADWSPDVAVIIDERSPYYLSTTRQLTESLYSGLRSQFYRMGTSFNLYLLSDVLENRVELPKVNIFLGAWYLEGQDRDTLKTALKGKTALWFYGSGYLSETGSSVENMTDLTGFCFDQHRQKRSTITFRDNRQWNGKLENSAFDPVRFAMVPEKCATMLFDKTIDYAPCWSVKKQLRTEPLASFEDGTTALAVKDYSGFQSIYCSITSLPAQFLRNVLKNNGVHIYLDSDDVVSTDGHFLSVSASQAGLKTIFLDKKDTLVRVDTGEVVQTPKGVLREKFQQSQTKFFWIQQP